MDGLLASTVPATAPPIPRGFGILLGRCHSQYFQNRLRLQCIGPLNLDPHSIDLNTGLGAPTDFRALADSLRQPFFAGSPKRTCQLDGQQIGSLSWHLVVHGEAVILRDDPQAGTWRTLTASFSRTLPEGRSRPVWHRYYPIDANRTLLNSAIIQRDPTVL